MAKFAILVKF